MSIPTLKQQANGTVLTLHDKPYIMLAGEVGNSILHLWNIWRASGKLPSNSA